ncbi:unnamed protein product [Fusarium graminearum]|nr:unnamed protein product [Fusarium graminearum]
MPHQHTPLESPAGKNVTATIAYHSGPALPTSPIAGVTTLQDCTQQVVAVTDIRPSVSYFTLDGNGFQVVKHTSAVSSPSYGHSSWTDPVVRKEVYDPEIIKLAKSLTGAKKVMILLASSRNVPFKEPELAPPCPMPAKSNSSCKEEGFNPAHKLPTTRAKGFHKGEEEGPVRKPHKDWGPSADEEDGVSFWHNPPGVHGTFESDVLLIKANPKHKWYWISDQTPDEVLLMKIMDNESEKDGSDIAGGVHHCLFHLPGTEKEEVRESIETKFIAFW